VTVIHSGLLGMSQGRTHYLRDLPNSRQHSLCVYITAAYQHLLSWP